MTAEWQRVAGDAYVRALVAKYKAEAGKVVRTYDADCMAAALAAVAPMIAAAEREACAALAERFPAGAHGSLATAPYAAAEQAADEIAAAIRARGTP